MVYKITQGNQYNYHKLTLKPLNKKSFKGVGYTARALKGLKVLQLEVGAQRALKPFVLSPVAPWSEVLVLVVDLLGGHLQGVKAARQPLNLDSGSKPLALRHQIWGSLLLPSN